MTTVRCTTTETNAIIQESTKMEGIKSNLGSAGGGKSVGMFPTTSIEWWVDKSAKFVAVMPTITSISS